MEILKQINLVSRRMLFKDGILFIIWGWLMFYVNMAGYIERAVFISHALEKLINTIGLILGLLTMGITIHYYIVRRKDVKTKTGTSLRYIWFSMFIALVLINLIQNNVLKSINFTLQHPIFMVVIAFAIVTTGRIFGNRLFLYGGVIFAILALASSYLPLADQLLLEAIGWLIAIILPGHLMLSGIDIFRHHSPTHK